LAEGVVITVICAYVWFGDSLAGFTQVIMKEIGGEIIMNETPLKLLVKRFVRNELIIAKTKVKCCKIELEYQLNKLKEA